VLSARAAAAVHTTGSLNQRLLVLGDGDELCDSIGVPDAAIEAIADRDALRRALRILPERLGLILSMRFLDELTQAQIADKIGTSQMHVSRLIARGLDLLRSHMMAEQPTQLA
jgi:RNA polymerase sigma-B factor